MVNRVTSPYVRERDREGSLVRFLTQSGLDHTSTPSVVAAAVAALQDAFLPSRAPGRPNGPPPANPCAVYALLLCACLAIDSAAIAEEGAPSGHPEVLLTSASVSMLAALGHAWGLSDKTRNLLLLHAQFDRHRHVATSPLPVLVAFERVRPTLVSTGWMTPDDREALSRLLAAMDVHCRRRIASYRESFPERDATSVGSPPGALEATLMLLRCILREPIYLAARTQRDGQAPPLVRQELTAIVTDAAVARFQTLRAASFAHDGQTQRGVAEGALDLTRRLFDDIEADAERFRVAFQKELNIVGLTAEIYFQQFSLMLRCLDAACDRVAALLRQVDRLNETRAWRSWDSGRAVRQGCATCLESALEIDF
ncbi:hypothetical protein HKX48_004438 [Thoreauomyces humboldtii]|nr:hypothetical protein HKX48_004438 [Thoreauomyces humboldtii]